MEIASTVLDRLALLSVKSQICQDWFAFGHEANL